MHAVFVISIYIVHFMIIANHSQNVRYCLIVANNSQNVNVGLRGGGAVV